MTQQTALILGATSDIGFAIAEQLRAKGTKLMLTARNTEDLKKKTSGWKEGELIGLYQFDADQPSTHKAFVKNLPVVPDIAVCVFGYLGDQRKAEADWDESNRIIQANYTGAVSVLNCIAETFMTRKSGTIVGISSVAGDRGRQSNYIYGSAKAGFTTYLAGLRNRLFPYGCHVVTVKPGFVDTKMTAGLPLPKPLTAKPEQVAKATVKAIGSKKNKIHVLPLWGPIMFVIASVPEFVFKRLKL